MLFANLIVRICTLDNYDPEGYNPESPGLTPAGRHPYRQFIPRVQTQRSNLIGLTSNEGQGSRGSRYGAVLQAEHYDEKCEFMLVNVRFPSSGQHRDSDRAFHYNQQSWK